MNSNQINTLLSWLILLLSLFIINNVNDIAGILVLFLFPLFRDLNKEKSIAKRFYEKNQNILKLVQYITLLFALIVLAYTIYKLIITSGTTSEGLPGLFTIMSIFIPICFVLIKYEIYVFRQYSKIA